MQMTDEVVAALEVLRAAAENDFERLAIEKFEAEIADVTRTEILDETHQRFNGVVFQKDSSGRYHAHLGMHRYVWNFFFGEPPEGYEIHHIDGNPANNNVENLQLLTKAEHYAVHNQMRQKEFVCDFCGKRILKSPAHETDLHFCDDICKGKWRHYNGKTNTERVCVICGKKFVTKKRGELTAQTCSPHCRNILRWRREREKQIATKKIPGEVDTTD